MAVRAGLYLGPFEAPPPSGGAHRIQPQVEQSRAPFLAGEAISPGRGKGVSNSAGPPSRIAMLTTGRRT